MEGEQPMRDDFDRHRGFYLIGVFIVVVFVLFFAGAFDDFKSKGSGNGTSDAAAKAASSTKSSQPADSATGKNTSDNKSGSGIGVFGTKPSDHIDDGKPLAPKPPATGDGNPPPATATPPVQPAQPITGLPSSQPIDDGCEPEISIGQHRVVKAGCIVTGDVLVRPAGSNDSVKPVPVFDNRQGTGAVQLLDADYDVWNVQGASVYPKGTELLTIVIATKAGGCGTGRGCFDGVFDWHGKRLDQP